MTQPPHTPMISVIVAVHDVCGQIAEAIASLQAQTFDDFEALVVDDGSTDGSGEVAQATFGDDPRFRLIRQENRGLSGARNTGLDAARGTYVAFLDGDDAFAPGFLATVLRAITEAGTDWAACAIALWHPDGQRVTHPAIHGHAPEAAHGGAVQRLDLHEAKAVARLFPSAWNKLYRRAVIGDLRFPQGSWFEDHEFYWAFAQRARQLAYVAEPLYWHRRGRPGQITGTDSDRVFEQFDVLDRLHARLAASDWPDAQAGFARLATRLVHERALVVQDRTRRARFLEVARARFAAWGVRYDAQWDASISQALGLAMAGLVPVSVVVLACGADASGLERCLAALSRQGMADFDLTVVAPPQVAVPARLQCGLAVRHIVPGQGTIAELVAQLAGQAVVFLGGNEAPTEDGLMVLANLLFGHDAALAFGGFNRLRDGYHDGWTDNTVPGAALRDIDTLGAVAPVTTDAALRIFPALGNRIFRADALRGRVMPLPCDAQSVQALVLATALDSARVGYTPLPVAETPDVPQVAGTLALQARWAGSLERPELPGSAVPLPRGWRGVLFFRLARFAAPPGAGGAFFWARAVLIAARHGWLRVADVARPDPETPVAVRRLCRILSAPDR